MIASYGKNGSVSRMQSLAGCQCVAGFMKFLYGKLVSICSIIIIAQPSFAPIHRYQEREKDNIA